MGNRLKKSSIFYVPLLAIGLSFAGQVSAQQDSPTPTIAITASPSASPTSSPSATPIPTVSGQPATGSTEPTASATASPTPKVDKKKVLGSTTKLGSTSAAKEIAKWLFGGLVGVAVIVYGLKITRNNAES